MFETAVADGVLQVRRPGARWLATTHDGGYRRADAAYNVSVSTGFERTDLAAYVAERRERAGFDTPGPALLTGVDLEHARGARAGPVEVIATVGLSNPATLPLEPGEGPSASATRCESTAELDESPGEVGTVNLLVGTTRSLDDGALATLLATAVEAKAATLLAATGFTGTTSDGVVVGCDPAGEPSPFAGSATAVGDAARACVRDAVRASLRSRYAGADAVPESVAAAEHGVRTDRATSVFRP
ncbi:MAG: adenosylcobinamide amidohydrolase [Haloarculaceae archaeon]